MMPAKKTYRKFSVILLLVIALCAWGSTAQTDPGDGSEEPLSHQTLKGKLDLYVYLVWMWLLIGILISVLVLKVREADRVHRMEHRTAADRPKVDADTPPQKPSCNVLP